MTSFSSTISVVLALLLAPLTLTSLLRLWMMDSLFQSLRDKAQASRAAKLLMCPWCLSVYLSALLTAGIFLLPFPTLIFSLIFSFRYIASRWGGISFTGAYMLAPIDKDPENMTIDELNFEISYWMERRDDLTPNQLARLELCQAHLGNLVDFLEGGDING